MKDFKVGELVVYAPIDNNGDFYKFELGKIKSINKSKKTAFVYYHTGETAANTDLSDLIRITNQGLIKTNLGGGLD
ncbi:MAG: hypothetical protein HFJ36_00120 [Clostridia bacterium]|nr:hypothetical protein [Clostridia bacterium]